MKGLKFLCVFLVLVFAGIALSQNQPATVTDRFKLADWVRAGTFTFTNKTLTSPTITGASLSGTSAFTGPITLSSTFTQTTTSALTSGTIRSSVINQTHTGDGAAILEALRVNIASAVQTGSWANAIVGRIAYSGATGDAGGGLAAAMCSEVVLPAISTPAGSYFAHDLEFEAPASYVANTGSGFNVAYLRFGLYGNVTAMNSFEDESYFMRIDDAFTDASGNMWYDNTLRIQIETTDWFIPLSDAEGEYSSAYMIDISNTTDASSLTAASIATDGGLAVAQQLYLGDDLDMSVSGDGVYDITLRTNVADALSITDGTDLIVFKTSATKSVVITPNTDVVGAFTAGTVTSDGAVTATSGVDLGTSQALVGTTAMTIGSGAQTVAVSSSDWAIDATGIMTGIGAITSNGIISAGAGVTLPTASTHLWNAGGSVVLATSGTDVACSDGDRYWVEIMIPYNVTLTGLSYLVGSVGATDSVVVQLCSSAGAEVATSRAVGTAAVIVGTAAQFQSVAFSTPYAATAGLYYAVVQFNGTTAKFRAYPVAGSKFIAGTVAGTWGTKADITPGTTFTADKGPIVVTY